MKQINIEQRYDYPDVTKNMPNGLKFIPDFEFTSINMIDDPLVEYHSERSYSMIPLYTTISESLVGLST